MVGHRQLQRQRLLQPRQLLTRPQHAYCHSNSYANCDSNSYAYAHSYAYCHSNSYAYTHSYANRNS